MNLAQIVVGFLLLLLPLAMLRISFATLSAVEFGQLRMIGREAREAEYPAAMKGKPSGGVVEKRPCAKTKKTLDATTNWTSKKGEEGILENDQDFSA